MNPITYTLTPEDWGEYALWSFQKTKPPQKFYRNKLLLFLAGFFMAFLVILSLGMPLPLLLGPMFYFATIGALCLYLQSPEQIKRRVLASAKNEAHPSVEKTVSLTPRGVLEADDCEERLTLFEAIAETALTEKFLYAKDRRGGVLLIPVRAFGSAAAATAFHLELENRRMRQAVGLTPTATAASTTPVAAQPTAGSAVPPQGSQPWWRSAPKTENESLTNRQQNQ
jgi:hypothetical protein